MQGKQIKIGVRRQIQRKWYTMKPINREIKEFIAMFPYITKIYDEKLQIRSFPIPGYPFYAGIVL
jgi:hypothetical protein